MKRLLSLSAASLVLLAAPAMAATPMKTSVPAKSGAAVTAKATATADRFRPTSFLGVEEARTLGSGDVVMGLGNGLSGSWGVSNGLEAGANGGLNVNLGSSNTFNLPVGAYAKTVLVRNEGMSIGLGGSLNAALANVGTNFTLGASAFVPVSFWNVGPGDLHVVPRLTLPLTPSSAFGSSNVDVAIGYSMPLTEAWTLHVADRYNFGGSNTLALGNRVGLTPNVTVDLGNVSLTSNAGTNNFAINLLTLNAFFGAPSAELTKAWGL